MLVDLLAVLALEALDAEKKASSVEEREEAPCGLLQCCKAVRLRIEP